MAITVKVNTTGANIKLLNTARKSKMLAKRTVEQLKDIGKNYAKSIAPKFTGDTAAMIRGMVRETNKGPTATIISPNSTKGGTNRFYPNSGKYRDFNLVRWMHETGGIFRSPNPFGQVGKRHIKSGEPQYMYKTTDYLNKIKKQVAQGHFKGINR